MQQKETAISSEAKMKAVRFRLAIGGLICLLVLTGTAKARIHLSIGLGTSFGHHYPRYYGHGYPHHRWYGGYYGPWPGHCYSPRSSLWIHQSYPIVLSPPLRVKTPAENPRPKPQPQLSQSMRQQQSELLKVLKIGDKENRIGAICELASFYFDEKAQAALEDILLTDPDPEIRKKIATSLGKTANARVTPALKIARAKDPDRGVRQAAYRSLIMIEGY
jgi:hypothetical protein